MLATALAFALVAATIVPYITQNSLATGVQVYADLTDDTGNPPTPATVTTLPEFADAITTEVQFSYTATSAFGIGDTVTLTFPTGFTVANTCTAPTTDADGSTVADGSAGVSGVQYTYTFSGTAVATVEFCVDVTAPSAVTDNYSVALSSTNDNDFGAVLLYINDDAGNPDYQNRVQILAQIAPVLQLSITDTSDVATDICDLGVMDVVTLSSCVYRVYAGTNQTTGTSTLSIQDITASVTGNLDGLSKGLTADLDDVDATAANTDVASGVEGTGFTAVETGTTYTLQGNYDDGANPGDDPVPTTLTTLGQASGFIGGTIGGGNYITVTHYGAADASSQTGSYVGWARYTLVAAP